MHKIRKNSKVGQFFLLLSLSIFYAVSLQASSVGGWIKKTKDLTENLNITKKTIESNPFLREQSKNLQLIINDQMQGLGLTGITVNDKIKYIKNLLNNGAIDVMPKDAQGTSFSLAAPATSQGDVTSLYFSVNDIPVCDLEIRIVDHLGKSYVFGALPDIDEKGMGSYDWSTANEAFLSAQHWFKDKGNNYKVTLVSQTKCLLSKDNALVPVWQLVVAAHGLSYQVFADKDDVYQARNLFFDMVDATISAYPRSPVDPATEKFTDQVNGDGTLTSDSFATNTTFYQSTTPRAVASNEQFIYDPSDYRFAEASIFVHINQMLVFYESLGYPGLDLKPLTVMLHATINNTKNNALYEPPTSSASGYPTILIGDGDGVVLQNLPLDGDVVSHEFGHHIIYRTLKETSGESLVIHEGLADYFTYAKQNDPCLGPSICVQGDENVCVVYGKCLRTGINTLHYGTSDFDQLEAHLQGQIIGGLLLDLSPQIDRLVVAKTMYNALAYLVYDSGIRDFLLALLLSDYKSGGNNTCYIYNAAIARGFGSLLADVDCTKPANIPVPNIADNSDLQTPTTSSSSGSSTKKKNIFGCSSAPLLPPSDSYPPWWLLFVLPLFPVLISLVRRRRHQHYK